MKRRFTLSMLAGALTSFAMTTAQAADRVLINPATILATAERMDFKGKNEFVFENTRNGPALRSTPRESASGLYQKTDIDGAALTKIRWSWMVETLQPTVDIRKLSSEDFGATVFFVFGEPSLWNKDVPTLAYTWTATPVKNGAIIQSLRFASLKYVHLRGVAEAGRWQTEQRNVAADYRAIFGQEPPKLKYVAIFNDNDQTKAPVTALFGAVVSGN